MSTKKKSAAPELAKLLSYPERKPKLGPPSPRTKTIAESTAELQAEVDSRSRAEHLAWSNVIQALEETGAVTKDDLRTGVREKPTTPGLKLLAALREWGETKGKLHTIGVISGNVPGIRR